MSGFRNRDQLESREFRNMACWVRWQGLVLPVGVIGCLLVLIVPLPAGMLDVLLAANIAAALIVLLTTLHVRTPLEFSLFPTLLLTTTLSRLVLNVASTRLILTGVPHGGLDAAGQVIRGFGEFVTGDHTLVGLILFAIIVVIQFVVITKGSARISEVAARFALDGMPGRQMAIDADLSAGLIRDQEAQRRREALTEQADFYGAMDGASRFVRGDAIAGLLITGINLVGGLMLGVLDAGMSPVEAGSVYSRLTVGDGLVSQVPALLISLAAGLLVTRSSREVDLPREFLRQLFSRAQVLAVAGGFLGLLMWTRLPALPLLTIALACSGLAFALTRTAGGESGPGPDAARDEAELTQVPQKRIEDYLAIDPVEIEIGAGLIRLADPNRGGDLLSQITDVRRRVAVELGIVMPKVRIRDNLGLGRRAYCIKLSGNAVAQGQLYPDRCLVAGVEAGELPGPRATDPCSGTAAVWVSAEHLAEARQGHCQLQEPSGVLAAHLRQVVRFHAAELLTRDATRHLVDELRKGAPAVVDELIPDSLRLGEVQQVLQRLLREHVPIRQLQTIMEALGDEAPHTREPRLLVEQVRRRLARTLCTRYRDERRQLRVVTLDPVLEDRIVAGVQPHPHGYRVHLSPAGVRDICQWIGQAVEPPVRAGNPPVVLVGAEARAAVRELTAARLPQLVVLSYDEITRDTVVEAVRVVRDAVSAAA